MAGATKPARFELVRGQGGFWHSLSHQNPQEPTAHLNHSQAGNGQALLLVLHCL